MTRSRFENEAPTIILVERQTFASESMANYFRSEFKQYAIVQYGDDLAEIEKLTTNLKLIVITKSTMLSGDEKFKSFERSQDIFRTAPVALLGGSVEQDSLGHLEKFNLRGIFPDATPTNTLIAGLKFILEGGEYFPNKFNKLKASSRSKEGPREHHLFTTLLTERTFNSPNPFTKRERAVLSCLAQGQPNKVIANQLAIAENTIKIHIRNILKKLNVSNRTEAILTAHRMSLIELH